MAPQHDCVHSFGDNQIHNIKCCFDSKHTCIFKDATGVCNLGNIVITGSDVFKAVLLQSPELSDVGKQLFLRLCPSFQTPMSLCMSGVESVEMKCQKYSEIFHRLVQPWNFSMTLCMLVHTSHYYQVVVIQAIQLYSPTLINSHCPAWKEDHVYNIVTVMTIVCTPDIALLLWRHL